MRSAPLLLIALAALNGSTLSDFPPCTSDTPPSCLLMRCTVAPVCRASCLLMRCTVAPVGRAPAAAQVACTGGPCAAGTNCLCSALSNSGEACGYIASMNGNCSGCHNCPGSGWIMGTGITCSATCSSADSVWTACGNSGHRLPAPPAGSVTKTACAATNPSTTTASTTTTPSP